jgi:hypothetical protein
MADPIFDQLTAEILKQFANGSLRHKIKVEQGDIRSTNYIAGSQGWRITPTSLEIYNADPVVIPKKAGTPTGGVSGQMVLDTTAHKLWINEAGTYKYINLT